MIGHEIHVGFTGTRAGMTPAQALAVHDIVAGLVRLADEKRALVLHHGDCVGADAEMHAIALAAGFLITIHPPVDSEHRAWCHLGEHVFLLPPKTHLARNRDIVSTSTVLIAAPRETVHQDRGGTWYTHDRAIQVGVPVALALPDGRIVHPGRPWPVKA